MDPATMQQVVTALGIIAKIVQALGPAGITLLFLAGPVVVVIAVLLLSHFNNRRLSAVVDAYRADADRRFEEFRVNSDRRYEQTRGWMEATVAKYGEALEETRQFYKDNVELVKSWERMAEDFAEVISLNTRTQQKLVDRIEHNQFCPIVKQGSRP